MSKTAKKPFAVIKAGGVRAALWANNIEKDGKEIATYSIQVDRTYKQGDEFKRTNHFNVNDLPKLAAVAWAAYERLCLTKEENGEGDQE